MAEKPKKDGVSDLQKSIRKIQLEVPKLDPQMMQDPSRLQEVVKAKMEGAQKVREGMGHALSYLDDLEKWMNQIENEEEREVAEETAAPDVDEMKEYIKACLSHEQKRWRKAAGVAYLRHAFNRDLHSYEEAEQLLKDLEELEFLEKDDQGPVSIGYNRYKVSESFGFADREVKEIGQGLDIFSRKLKQLIHQKRTEEKEELKLQGENTLQDLYDRKPGRCLLSDIPPENFIDREGKECWRAGGSLLVDLNQIGERWTIRVLGGVGAIQRSIEESMRLGATLEHHMLTWDGPPGMGKAFERIVDGIMRTRDITEEDAEKCVQKMQYIWHLIKRAKEASKNKEELEVLKKEYAAEADISPEEFYGLDVEAKEGDALLVFDGVFQNKNGEPPVHNLFGLFNQERKDEELFIEFMKGPEHVEKFLAQFKGKKYSVARNFKNVPDRLGRVIRGIRGQVDMAAQINS